MMRGGVTQGRQLTAVKDVATVFPSCFFRDVSGFSKALQAEKMICGNVYKSTSNQLNYSRVFNKHTVFMDVVFKHPKIKQLWLGVGGDLCPTSHLTT